jgi:hypothetical protein
VHKSWLTIGVLHSLKGTRQGSAAMTQQLFKETQSVCVHELKHEHNDTEPMNFEACFTVGFAVCYMENCARNNSQCCEIWQSNVIVFPRWLTVKRVCMESMWQCRLWIHCTMR